MDLEARLNELKVLDYELSTSKSQNVHSRHTSGFVLFSEPKLNVHQETKKQIHNLQKELEKQKDQTQSK